MSYHTGSLSVLGPINHVGILVKHCTIEFVNGCEQDPYLEIVDSVGSVHI